MKLSDLLVENFTGTVKEMRSRLFSLYNQDEGTFTVQLETGERLKGTPRSLRQQLFNIQDETVVGTVNVPD